MQPALRVGPQLVGEPGPEQDQHEAGLEPTVTRSHDRDHDQRHIGEKVPAQPDQGPGDDRPDRRLSP